jgi:short-subunit dehydrogenase
MKDLSNKTIWITGASDGIGKELALQLAQLGNRIILTARNKTKLEQTKAELKGNNHIVFPMDLLNTDAIPQAVNNLLTQAGTIDVLINNAGISQRSLIKDTSFDVDRRIMELDYFAVIYLTKTLLPHFTQRQTGSIVTISSVAGKLGTPMRSAYCAAKHAVIGFMDSLRAEVYQDNIEVLVVAPGSTKTNISKNALAGNGNNHGVTDPAIENGIAVDECVRQVIKGIKNNSKEILIAKGKEKLAVYVRRFFPKLLFKMVRAIKST